MIPIDYEKREKATVRINKFKLSKCISIIIHRQLPHRVRPSAWDVLAWPVPPEPWKVGQKFC